MFYASYFKVPTLLYFYTEHIQGVHSWHSVADCYWVFDSSLLRYFIANWVGGRQDSLLFYSPCLAPASCSSSLESFCFSSTCFSLMGSKGFWWHVWLLICVCVCVCYMYFSIITESLYHSPFTEDYGVKFRDSSHVPRGRLSKLRLWLSSSGVTQDS